MSDYDIITIGGGLGGAALAKSMAERGARVLVLERETKFKDRVRGEGMTPWGAAEARELGIYDLIMSSCGHELPRWDNYIGPMQVLHREMPATTPQGLPTLAFYHPAMQETLLNAAESAGAELRRGVRAKAVTPGAEPKVTIESDGGKTEEASARLVVGVDGRGSLVRKWGGFTEHRDAERLRLSGLLFEDSAAPQDTVRLVSDFERGRAAIIFPQGGSRVRMYFACGVGEALRLQGDKDVPRFIDESVSSGMPQEYFEGARPTGPLATFDGADNWVEQPYRDGVALIGDAAAATDPSWGQGLALTLRDARTLRDALTSNDDWDDAGRAYAGEHDRYFHVLHTVEDWLTQFFYETGPEADARRGRAFPLMAEDPTRQPDALFSGPDHPITDTMRRRFFGEE
ncbi:MAG: FAD-dependent monooxygenase [Chloroflexota bacterium]|nr:FAD-dependent monooxygenase [Chloroflexota bacterium]